MNGPVLRMCTEKFDTDGSLKSRVTQLRQDLAKMSNEEINQKVLQLMSCMKLVPWY